MGDLNVNWTQQDKNGRQVTRRNSFETPTLDTMAAEGMQPGAITARLPYVPRREPPCFSGCTRDIPGWCATTLLIFPLKIPSIRWEPC